MCWRIQRHLLTASGHGVTILTPAVAYPCNQTHTQSNTFMIMFVTRHMQCHLPMRKHHEGNPVSPDPGSTGSYLGSCSDLASASAVNLRWTPILVLGQVLLPEQLVRECESFALGGLCRNLTAVRDLLFHPQAFSVTLVGRLVHSTCGS